MKRSRLFRLLTCLLLGALPLEPMSAQQTPPTASDVFVGYVNGSAERVNYALYTHLCHAFVVADADGSLRPNKEVPSPRFAQEAHAHGVKLLLSLGGWGWDAQFAAMVLDPEAESRYVESVLRLVDESDYDGIDLDWEYPDSREEIPGFERLTRRFRAGLDELQSRKGREMTLTMAAAAHPRTLEWLSNDFLLETMDWVNVMTYDYAGGWAGFAGHNAPFKPSSRAPANNGLSVTKTFDYLLHKRGLPADRLALGLPLYGRAYSVPEPYADTANTERPGRSLTYRQANDLLRAGWRRTFDQETLTPWLTSPESDSVIAYDDKESIALKTLWAREQGLRGVFFWEVSQDLVDESNPLQEAAKAAWTKSP